MTSYPGSGLRPPPGVSFAPLVARFCHSRAGGNPDFSYKQRFPNTRGSRNCLRFAPGTIHPRTRVTLWCQYIPSATTLVRGFLVSKKRNVSLTFLCYGEVCE